MSTSRRVLLVEGSSDKSLFEKLIDHLALRVEVTVAKPTDVGGTFNSKQGVYNLLPLLLPQLRNEQLSALGVILDADRPEDGGGLIATVRSADARLAKYDYSPFGPLRADVSLSQGYIAQHPHGARPVGLWVMPDNASAGTLEDWISRCRHPGEDALWQHAQQAINTLPETRFKTSTQRAKADVATWLAWQKKPGEERYMLVKSLQTGTPLLNDQAPLYQGLCQWLQQVFAAPDDAPSA